MVLDKGDRTLAGKHNSLRPAVEINETKKASSRLARLSSWVIDMISLMEECFSES